MRRHGCRTAVLPPPVSSSPMCCPVLSSPLHVLRKCSPLLLRLHRPEKKALPQNPLYNSASPRQTSCDTMKPARIESQPSLFPIYHVSVCPVPQATLASTLLLFSFFFTLPPLGLNTCAKMHVLIKLQTGTRGFGSQRSSKKATLQK